jgi:hypothetical protein
MTEGSHVRVLHRQKRMTPNKNAAVQGLSSIFDAVRRKKIPFGAVYR